MVDSHDAETYRAKDSRLIWIDCEMTGLDIFGGDELVEVSVVPTDFDLNVLDEGVDYVIKPSEKAVNHMNDFVRQMHTRSGLINEWENGLSLAEAEQKVTEYVLRFTPEGVRPLLAGKYAHRGSFQCLLGDQAHNQALLDKFSIEKHIDAKTPPVFVWHTMTDDAVPVENTLMLIQACRAAGVSIEAHLFPEGSHGLSLANAETAGNGFYTHIVECVQCWPDLAEAWLRRLF